MQISLLCKVEECSWTARRFLSKKENKLHLSAQFLMILSDARLSSFGEGKTLRERPQLSFAVRDVKNFIRQGHVCHLSRPLFRSGWLSADGKRECLSEMLKTVILSPLSFSVGASAGRRLTFSVHAKWRFVSE